MKQIKYLIAAALVSMGLTACDKDGDTITTSGASAVELSGSGDVVIDKDNTGELALTLYWTDNSHLTTSDERVQAPVGTTVNTLQFASTETFDAPIELPTDAGTTSIQFTAESLNALVGRVGLEGGIASTLYIRMKSSLANNVPPIYSNIYKILVTPFSIDMTIGYVLDKDQGDTGWTLTSPNADGIYYGFLGASGWYNWWLQEGNGIMWGNDSENDGTPFAINSNDQHWNFWYPGQAGCYYTVVNTVSKEWSALLIPALSVSGDVNGDMTYDRKENKWLLSFEATQAGNINIQIAGTGKQYNIQTGTDDAAAIDTPVAFGQENGKLTFGATASTITVQVASAGEMTLTLNLNDPNNWTCEVNEGSEVPQEIAKTLYILGNDDTWNFDQYLTLYDEDNLCYAAAVNFNSTYGYYFSKALNDWTHINQDPSTSDKKLIIGGADENNIQAPGKGLYVTIASLGWMSYWYGMEEPISTVAYTGFNDEWSLTDMTADAEHPGVYTAQVTATKDTPWGVQILLNGSWDYYFGTYLDGSLRWSSKENGAPMGWVIGKTYTLTVDLCKCTYSLTE